MHKKVAIIGSGIAGLSAAAWLASEGFEVKILEQNYLPGGCSSSYWRKGFVFESGATTLIGLDEGMPLHLLSQKTGVQFNAVRLETPMVVHLPNGKQLIRYKDLEAWISEVNRVFPHKGQRPFWEFCYKTSQTIWETSTKQLAFPPEKLGDLLKCIRNTRLNQIMALPFMFKTVGDLLRKYGLDKIDGFKAFIDEQLIIAAQNHSEEVNVLFGAAALCYTQFGNYYVNGGLIELVIPLVQFIESNGGQVLLRSPVKKISKKGSVFDVEYAQTKEYFNWVIGAIPINNLNSIFPDAIGKKQNQGILSSKQLSSCFQIGIGFKKGDEPQNCLHHQVITSKPIPQTESKSFFVSYSHPADKQRVDDLQNRVLSVSTHVPNPADKMQLDKHKVVDFILNEMELNGLIQRSQILYLHASGPADWQKWTHRAWGFVGGYPQFKHIRPYQMLGSRLSVKGAYLAGDTAYPGQGIPGAALGGIIAAQKLISDI